MKYVEEALVSICDEVELNDHSREAECATALEDGFPEVECGIDF